MSSAEPSESRRARSPERPSSRRSGGGRRRRADASRRTFAPTLKTLDALASAGAQVSVRVTDLDRGDVVLVGDDHLVLPVGGVGIVPLLIEVAAQVDAGTLDPLEILERSSVEPVTVSGLWHHLKAPALPVCDIAVLAAASGDASAANALLARVGLDAVRARMEQVGLVRSALMDRFRDVRGPDDAPHVALGSAGELATVFAALVNSELVSPAVSAQVSEWLSLNQDLSLVASATGLDPFAHDDDRHQVLFVNKTGRADGVRAEAGVLAGPRAGVAYALIVCFDDLSVAHRLRAHDAFRTLGVDLMEYVF
ncbi:class A beta-lactamase-related serine hydrolase [Microbacterium sp. W1N]|uniref:class A beta-lactamase-related serine hydrolase n=1 Tax=Microbacterium festucae TaxID=2977531 RepID=UPI0021C06612|nr:class A beta-lactamase-related serine hydrolase [Microbacterium festucae]MCT9819665.1 class A beta-lactamase-related serine hydrolase [Microbacterium festucae]